MDSINIFGWILCVFLTISFIASLIFLPKGSSLDTSSTDTYQKNKIVKQKVKKEHL